MSKIIVIWKQEDEDGEVIMLDKTFDSQERADHHIKQMTEDAKTLDKYFKVVSVNQLSNEKISMNKAHKGRNMKGKGWHGESRRHSMARKGIGKGKR